MRLVALVAAAAVLMQVGAAVADGDPKRKVAVLEYRSGSASLPHIDKRLAAILKKQTSLKIVDADEARMTFPRLDADVVACAGDGGCVARIGGKLGVKEVLLVGVSEFGDVILTLQRIDVGDRKVSSRVAESFGPKDEPDDEALVGYLTRLMPPEDFLRYGMIHVAANLAGARVFVGGEDKGETPLPAIKVKAPARYDLKVTKDGYIPFRASVNVPPDGDIAVRADLSKEGGGGAWYGRWWVATLAGAVVIGAVGTGVWLGTRSPSEVPVGGHTM
ncbi:MAG TPA: PEGA domain-containing protein [Kofleriaceae bacterium]|nr:PEGA domain-containing protein [Kofleriaceae bacterium]